jgi:hypothetical protein
MVLEILKSIGDLAASLLGASEQLASQKRTYRDRLSNHLYKLSDLLLRISEGVHFDDCSELQSHLASLKDLLEGVVDEERQTELESVLAQSVHARELVSSSQNPDAVETLKRAAGTFRALASEVTVV